MTIQLKPKQVMTNNKLTLLFLLKVLVAYSLSAYIITFTCMLKMAVIDSVSLDELRLETPNLLWLPLWFPMLVYQIALNAIYESKYFWKGTGWLLFALCSVYVGWKMSGNLIGFIQKNVSPVGSAMQTDEVDIDI